MGTIARGRVLSDADMRGVGKRTSIHRCVGDVAVVDIAGVLVCSDSTHVPGQYAGKRSGL